MRLSSSLMLPLGSLTALSGCLGNSGTLVTASGVAVVTYFITPSIAKTGMLAFNTLKRLESGLLHAPPDYFHGAKDSTTADPNSDQIFYGKTDVTRLYKDAYHALFVTAQIPAIWISILEDSPWPAIAGVALNILAPMGLAIYVNRKQSV